jgi:hypothetical protein
VRSVGQFILNLFRFFAPGHAQLSSAMVTVKTYMWCDYIVSGLNVFRHTNKTYISINIIFKAVHRNNANNSYLAARHVPPILIQTGDMYLKPISAYTIVTLALGSTQLPTQW